MELKQLADFLEALSSSLKSSAVYTHKRRKQNRLLEVQLITLLIVLFFIVILLSESYL